MNAKQYKDAIYDLGLTQVECAELLGAHGATGRRWAARGITGTAAILLRLLWLGKVTIEDVQKCSGDSP